MVQGDTDVWACGPWLACNPAQPVDRSNWDSLGTGAQSGTSWRMLGGGPAAYALDADVDCGAVRYLAALRGAPVRLLSPDRA